jgi:hypothetical protein
LIYRVGCSRKDRSQETATEKISGLKPATVFPGSELLSFAVSNARVHCRGFLFPRRLGETMKLLLILFAVLLSGCSVTIGNVVTDVSVDQDTLLVEKCILEKAGMGNAYNIKSCQTKEYALKPRK